ncbi:MAG: CubicO group peptidase (beta-lactamase class C family) [Phenylobacterium sp.]|jgi:CubicO group peptidase (beta-lactamase class C family)
MIKSQAFGYADISNDIALTTDTPFNLGSVSKTVLGVTAAQMIEQNIVSLGTTIAQSNLNFTVDIPYFDAGNISLRQLVTHTAGIADSDSYQCAYYMLEDQGSLANAQ